MKNTLGLLLLGLILSYVKGETYIRQDSFCDNTNVKLICLNSTIILIKGFTIGDVKCKSPENNNDCNTNIDIALQNSCSGKHNCTLGTSLLSNNGCKRTPRFISTKYNCIRGLSTVPMQKETCTNALAAINCKSYYRINIKNVDTSNACAFCNEMNKLKTLCNNKQGCLNPSNYESCLFQQEITIMYDCLDPIVMPSPTYSAAVTKNYSNTELETEETFSSSESPTISSSQGVYYRNLNLNLDEEGRVLISDVSANITVMLCGLGWDDQDAQVVCRYKENSSIGHARVIEGVTDYETLPVHINCHWNETNPFLCNYILMDECNISTVAAVTCCNDSFGLTNMCTSPIVKQLSSPSSNGVAVGVSVGVIVLIGIVVTIFLLIKRFSKKDKLYSSGNINGDYIGSQAIALPSFPNILKHTRSNDDDDRQYRQNDLNFRNVSSRNNFSSPSYSLNALETGMIKIDQVNGYEYAKTISEEMHSASGDTYACSGEGVYDKAKNNRHVQTELNVYSHSIDAVYDTSDRRNEERTNDTYDHFFWTENDNNYDMPIRK